MSIDRTGCGGSQHGTANAYRYHGCRCPDATRANTLDRKRRRAGHVQPVWVDAIGVVRRRQALAVMGWGMKELAPLLGLSYRGAIAHTQHTRVHRDNHRRWCELYDRLSMTPGPNRYVRTMALRKGWSPPLAWDDDTIDDPQAKPFVGRRRARTRQDMAEDARFLASNGMTTHGIAARLNVSEPYVRGLLNSREVAA